MTKTLKREKSLLNNHTRKLRGGGINIFGKSDYDKSKIKPRVFQESKKTELPFMYFYDIQPTT
jgi:hypothetical protein